ncbi:hypothetical protein DUNSADRAFT_6764 [Dunaliella salina]|uniref:Encoded protein n=1 Tax=Dunaliella salina TaxID=3046 RepID=A0ABQ7H6N3_DUNSA|nr:hypothetical protein DUNSADRAFT_6764 [Dunaliella salina]|eukprot:KAF5842520.1 hypothetical protein DUNSADRAFT_6764 [Dunaliella salina]
MKCACARACIPYPLVHLFKCQTCRISPDFQKRIVALGPLHRQPYSSDDLLMRAGLHPLQWGVIPRRMLGMALPSESLWWWHLW